MCFATSASILSLRDPDWYLSRSCYERLARDVQLVEVPMQVLFRRTCPSIP